MTVALTTVFVSQGSFTLKAESLLCIYEHCSCMTFTWSDLNHQIKILPCMLQFEVSGSHLPSPSLSLFFNNEQTPSLYCLRHTLQKKGVVCSSYMPKCWAIVSHCLFFSLFSRLSLWLWLKLRSDCQVWSMLNIWAFCALHFTLTAPLPPLSLSLSLNNNKQTPSLYCLRHYKRRCNSLF